MATKNTDMISKIQKQTEEVVEVMNVNFEKVKDRGEKLEVLDDRAEKLLENSKVFQKTTKDVAQQEKFKNRKWKIILGVVTGLVVLIIIIVIVLSIPRESPATTDRAMIEKGQQQPL
uniref:vesicle-associated membrane protein 5-like n=1 Tax=Pristiophorus japonicus TaxID=55135 RepID=UPI00398F3319